VPAWIPYTLLRLALFGGTFALLWFLGVDYLWAAIAAAVVGLTVSYIFFPTLRHRVAAELAESRERRNAEAAASSPVQHDDRGVDEEAEDRD
jgi:ABC-type bacteriocin/lantibiotic exporter with double-glycine peptidase domain